MTSGITRREALKRGAAIAGAVWAVPAMQALNMSPATAHGDHDDSSKSGSQGSDGSSKEDQKGSEPNALGNASSQRRVA